MSSSQLCASVLVVPMSMTSKLYHVIAQQQHMYHFILRVNFSCNVRAGRVHPKRGRERRDRSLAMRAIFIAAAQLEPDGLPIRPPLGGAQIAVFHAVDQL